MDAQIWPQSSFFTTISSKKFADTFDFFSGMYKDRFQCEAEENDFDGDDATFYVHYEQIAYLMLFGSNLYLLI